MDAFICQMLPNTAHWKSDLIPQTSQDTLLASSTLDRLKQPAELLLQEKQHRLESALKDVALHIDEGDNRNSDHEKSYRYPLASADQKRYISGQQSTFLSECNRSVSRMYCGM